MIQTSDRKDVQRITIFYHFWHLCCSKPEKLTLMKLRIATLACLLFCSYYTAQSQTTATVSEKPVVKKKLSLDLSVIPGISIYKNGPPSDFVIGGETRLQAELSKKFAFIASAGYIHFQTVKSDLLTIKAGAKYYFDPSVYFAIEAGLGEYVKGGELLVYTPSVGMDISKKFDLGLKFETYSNLSFSYHQLGLRVGYKLF